MRVRAVPASARPASPETKSAGAQPLMECRPSKVPEAGDLKLIELRGMYEPYLNGLSCALLMPLPSWGIGARSVENWKRTAWGKISSGPGESGSPGGESSHF